MESSEPTPEPGLLTRLRNMWEFANIMQYIFIFGKAVKIDDDFDIEVLSRRAPFQEPVLRLILVVNAYIYEIMHRISKLNASSRRLPRNWLRLACAFSSLFRRIEV